MKVIIVNDYAYVNGGASQIALRTALLLAQSGVDTCLFTGVGPVSKGLKGKKNLEVICLNQSDILSDNNRIRAVVNGIWNSSSKKKFANLLDKYDPQNTVVHIHTLQKSLSSSCFFIAKKRSFKVIYTLHDFGIACPNLGFFDYKRTCICSKKAMSLSCLASNCDSRKFIHKIWRIIRQYVQEKIGLLPQNIDAFIAVSKFSLKILQQYIPKDKIVYVLGNPTEKVTSKKVCVSKNHTIIFIGRLSAEKNPVLLARCAKKMGVRIVFIGKGECAEKIKAVNPDAVLTGWLKKKDMIKYIENARCLILSSSWYETQGLVVSEVAAYGVPSIVPDTSAATDFVTDGQNGLVFKNGDEDSLCSCINFIMDDEFVDKLGDKAFKFYKKNQISDAKYVEKLKEVYRDIM